MECGQGHHGPSRCGPRPLRGWELIKYERMCRRTIARTRGDHKLQIFSDVDRPVELLRGKDGWECWQVEDMDSNCTHKCDRCPTGEWDGDEEYWIVKIASYHLCFREEWHGYMLVLQRSVTVPRTWERL